MIDSTLSLSVVKEPIEAKFHLAVYRLHIT